MKLKDLLQHLRKHGCVLLRHGGEHDVWHNPVTNSLTTVPRHREIPTGTCRAICRDLGIPMSKKR